jgi:thiamine pyrophosphokinase
VISLVVSKTSPLTLIGAGEVTPDLLTEALRYAPTLVACDGGAKFALDNNQMPVAVIGDLDSIDDTVSAQMDRNALHKVSEQESTDFEKALQRCNAPLILGIGFTGGRLDHELAAFSTLMRYDSQPLVLLGAQDVVFLAPKQCTLSLPIGMRFSLYPMAPVSGHSVGLRWPIAGLAFAPGGRIGTSNEVCGPVELSFDARHMLVILPRSALPAVLAALMPDGADA